MFEMLYEDIFYVKSENKYKNSWEQISLSILLESHYSYRCDKFLFPLTSKTLKSFPNPHKLYFSYFFKPCAVPPKLGYSLVADPKLPRTRQNFTNIMDFKIPP